nr:glycosyltransferase family 4 protein [Agromyces seonyuensis]
MRRSLGEVAAIVCVSEALAASYRAQLPPELAERVHVVVNGVDAERFAPADARPVGPLRVRFVGRMIPDKGAETLVRAARRLDRADVEVVLVGSRGFAAGDDLSDYERGLRDLAGDAPGIRFEPFVDRDALPALLASADVFVVPSQWADPCPLTIGEGMASGAAVVASRVGGIPELLGDAGVLVEPGDADALADVIAGLADDRERLGALQRAARERALAHDWGWSWTTLRGILESALDPA